MTNEQWEQFEDISQRTGLRVQKIAAPGGHPEYYIVDHNGRHLSLPYTSNEAAALALITDPPKPKPTNNFADACTQHGKAKPQRLTPRKRNRSMSIMEAL